MCGGASDQQKQIEQQQQSLMATSQAEASQVFAQNQQLYAQMMKAFAPILDKGPSQEGFSKELRTSLETSSSDAVSTNYQNAEKAVRQQFAGSGGGNEYIPAGQEQEIASEVAQSAAHEQSAEENQIIQADYATGRENYFAAESALTGAGHVFDPSTAITGEAINAGSAASKTAADITSANNSWMGIVGGLAGAAATAYAGR